VDFKPSIAYATTAVKTSKLSPDRGRDKAAIVTFTELVWVSCCFLRQ